MTSVTVASANDVRDRVRDASSRGTPLRVVGRATWLDAGRPVSAVESVSTRELSGIVDYVPGDLTLTARAGTSLAEIAAEAARHNQWLALDPHGGDEGTLGATIATASSGPLSTAFGSPRDLVLGIEFVTGTGTIARAGGRVVKNVAGFDLTRLMTGAWGTLGVITEATVRLHARPRVDQSMAVAITGDASSVGRARQLLRRLPFTPYACEVLNDSLAQLVVGRSELVVLFRLAGNAESVAAQRAALLELGQPFDVGDDVWTKVRTAEPPGAMVFRLSRRPTEVAYVWEEATALARAVTGTLVHASPARGIVRCIVPNEGTNASQMSDALARPSPSRRIGERLPEQLWISNFPGRGMTGIAGRLKAAFDPRGVLNPGILGDKT